MFVFDWGVLGSLCYIVSSLVISFLNELSLCYRCFIFYGLIYIVFGIGIRCGNRLIFFVF